MHHMIPHSRKATDSISRLIFLHVVRDHHTVCWMFSLEKLLSPAEKFLHVWKEMKVTKAHIW